MASSRPVVAIRRVLARYANAVERALNARWYQASIGWVWLTGFGSFLIFAIIDARTGNEDTPFRTIFYVCGFYVLVVKLVAFSAALAAGLGDD